MERHREDFCVDLQSLHKAPSETQRPGGSQGPPARTSLFSFVPAQDGLNVTCSWQKKKRLNIPMPVAGGCVQLLVSQLLIPQSRAGTRPEQPLSLFVWREETSFFKSCK